MAENKQQNAAQKEDLNDLMRVRREKMEKFREMGVAPFGHRYEVTHHADELLAEFASLGEEAEGETEVSIAGRLMAIRGHGKASFGVRMDL